MNGKERVRIQERNGVREIVCDIDNMKIKYSSSSVHALTPRVETNLRLGRKAQIMMKIQFIPPSSTSTPSSSTSSTTPLQTLSSSPDPQQTQEITEGSQAKEERQEGIEKQAEKEMSYHCILSYPMKYPFEPLIIEIIFSENSCFDSETKQEIQTQAQEYSNQQCGETGYSLQLIDYVKELIEKKLSSDSKNDLATGQTSQQPTQEQPEDSDLTSMTSPSQPYKCKQCRQNLFYSYHILHNPINSTQEKEITLSSSRPSHSCSSIFLNEIDSNDHTISWLYSLMSSTESTDLSSSQSSQLLSGRILCPTRSCRVKVGVWDWIGSKCSCGYWTTPAIQFHSNKIDPPIPFTSKATVVSGGNGNQRNVYRLCSSVQQIDLSCESSQATSSSVFTRSLEDSSGDIEQACDTVK